MNGFCDALRELVEEWEREFLTWRANDGGLTMAASDGLADCNAALTKETPEELLDWMELSDSDPFSQDLEALAFRYL